MHTEERRHEAYTALKHVGLFLDHDHHTRGTQGHVMVAKMRFVYFGPLPTFLHRRRAWREPLPALPRNSPPTCVKETYKGAKETYKEAKETYYIN
jgi:hypothetical protein